jgi:hypothetical protein
LSREKGEPAARRPGKNKAADNGGAKKTHFFAVNIKLK